MDHLHGQLRQVVTNLPERGIHTLDRILAPYNIRIEINLYGRHLPLYGKRLVGSTRLLGCKNCVNVIERQQIRRPLRLGLPLVLRSPNHR